MKKRILFLTMFLLTLVCASCGEVTSNPTKTPTQAVSDPSKVSIFSRPTVKKEPGKRKDWDYVSSFVCYYGDFNIEFQSQFDVVIMHSNTLYQDPQAKEKVKQLQDAGCYIVSYITIGEDDELSVADGLGEGGYASYYVYENGVPKMNTNWNSYFVDAGNPVWQAKVINETAKILSYGVDGIFMDTLDTVDIDISSMPGMVDLVRKLDETFPDAKLVANRGFTVLPYISAHIDGLMFESFNTTINFDSGIVEDLDEVSNEWNENVACNTINAVRRYDYFPVFALDYVNEFEYDYMPKSYYNRSWQYDFIPYNTYDIHLSTPVYPKDKEGNMIIPNSKRGELALSKLNEGGSLSGGNNADTTTANLAFKDNGTTVSVSSTYAGYNSKALNDGWYATDDNHIQANWSKEAWASTDNKLKDHWIEFDFGAEKEVSQVLVHWANDNDTYYSPKLAYVEAWINGEWVEVARIDNTVEDSEDDFRAFETTWSFEFNTVTTQKIRITQPKGCGAHDKFGDPIRPGIMWVSEVQIFKEVTRDYD